MHRRTPEQKSLGQFHQLKIADFGIARRVDESGKCLMKVRSGTAGYIAPEIKGNNTIIDRSIDMWAFGVMLYEMSTGYKPTQFRNYKYESGPIPFRQQDWKRLSNQGSEVQKLIVECLQLDPQKRITAAEALEHCWFKTI